MCVCMYICIYIYICLSINMLVSFKVSHFGKLVKESQYDKKGFTKIWKIELLNLQEV